MTSMAKNEIREPSKTGLSLPAQGSDGGFLHAKRLTTNRNLKAKNWLEESWKSLEHFNHSHLGRLHASNKGDVKKVKKPSSVDTITESSIDVDCNDFSVKKNYNGGKQEFEIPSLPRGKCLVMNIHTTWGDKYYVGLNGVEIFTEHGVLVPILKIQADPPDLTVLPGCKNDPRTVDNLLNGVNRTCDDINMWLAPFTSGSSHFIYIDFAEPTNIAMIRIWNYNKSRIHSERGARAVTITLDEVPVFSGEINKASGSVVPNSSFGDNILFTTDESILERISEHDNTFDDNTRADSDSGNDHRPSTSNDDINEVADLSYKAEVESKNTASSFESVPDTFCAKCLQMKIVSNWGDPHHVGLTGVQVLGEDNEPILLTDHKIADRSCDKTDNTSPNAVDRLIDDTNITMADEHMWTVPFSRGDSYPIEINFVQAAQITGFRVWNYNGSFEDTYKGVKEIEVRLDDRPVSPSNRTFILRRAPGNLHYDFAQDVLFEQKPSTQDAVSEARSSCENSIDIPVDINYDTPYMPTGFVYKIELFDSWGDLYYIGLNGIELFSAVGSRIVLTEKEIAAFPSSVNILGQTAEDMRTPDKLIDGVNDTREGQHMWLSPILPGQVNYVYVIFDTPQTVSMIKLWNYAKTSSRGVKNFAVLVDDLLVYNGVLQPVSSLADKSVDAQYVLFSEDKDLLTQMNPSYITCEVKEQDVRWNDNNRIIENRPNVDQGLRPTTSLVTMAGRVKARF